MSNTALRIISALVMAALIIGAILISKLLTILIFVAVSALCLDEILKNLAGMKRSSKTYLSLQVIVACLFIINFVFNSLVPYLWANIILALCFNLFLAFYLFFIPLEAKFMRKKARTKPWLLSILILFPMLTFPFYFYLPHWSEYLLILMIVNFTMDSGAWLFGKNFGKTALWPKVSPKKTVEGLLGGILVSGLCGYYSWKLLINEQSLSWYFPIIFGLCGAVSQIGDLVQSKIKREFEVKDSSSRIPGHGGVYDRIDSLIFLSPFFAIIVKYFA